MKILVINGSPRANGRSKKMTQYVTMVLNNKGINVTELDVRNLPLMNGESDNYENEEVIRLKNLAQEADGFFIASPEYHNGMSGVLKNALDFLNYEQFATKPVSIGASSGGGKGGINALNNLRLVLRGVGALVLTKQVVLDPADVVSDTQLSQIVLERLNSSIEELILYTEFKHSRNN